MSVAAVVVAGLLAGGCAPRMKPLGYMGSILLTGTGVAVFSSGAAVCNEDGLACIFGGIQAMGLGTVLGVTGLGILLATVLSPSAPEDPTSQATPLSPITPPDVPATPWPAPPPARSPTAPSGSPLAPLQSQALSMRSGSRLAVH